MWGSESDKESNCLLNGTHCMLFEVGLSLDLMEKIRKSRYKSEREASIRLDFKKARGERERERGEQLPPVLKIFVWKRK